MELSNRPLGPRQVFHHLDPLCWHFSSVELNVRVCRLCDEVPNQSAILLPEGGVILHSLSLLLSSSLFAHVEFF